MTNLVRTAPNGDRSWSPVRDLLGFDPFAQVRPNAFEYDVTRTDNGYDIEIPVPGFKAQHIDVLFQDGVLSVSGKNDRRTFTRSFTVPEDVDPDAINAKVEDGMLSLTLNRRPEAQPKKIHVN